MSMYTSRPTTTVAPVSEPVTLAEAKKQIQLPDAVTFHDSELNRLISEAAEQYERDTDSYLRQRTVTLTADSFRSPLPLPVRPIQSISSITYYDGANASQTLSTDIYELDAPNRFVRLKYQQSWPTVADRWDAITITLVCGYANTSVDPIPETARRAILLQIAKWFQGRDMMEPNTMSGDEAYERLIARDIRPTYP